VPRPEGWGGVFSPDARGELLPTLPVCPPYSARRRLRRTPAAPGSYATRPREIEPKNFAGPILGNSRSSQRALLTKYKQRHANFAAQRRERSTEIGQ
jgi:hypothetical protein